MRYQYDKYPIRSFLFILCFSVIFQNSIIHADCPPPVPSKVDVVDAKGDYDRAWNKLTRLETHGKFLEAKRYLAVILCDSNTSDIDQKFDNFLLATAMFNVHGQLEAYADGIKMAKNHIDKLQIWAEINNEITAHCRTLYEAEQDAWQKWHKVSELVDKYNCHAPSDKIEKPDRPGNVYYPQAGTVYWNCFGAEHYGGDCLAMYDTPYTARDDHKAFCGGYKDPTPDVAGCGKEYYTCNDKHMTKHGVIGCTKAIIYTQIINDRPRTVKSESCPAQFRKCTVTLGNHRYRIIAGNPIASGLGEFHVNRQKRRR